MLTLVLILLTFIFGTFSVIAAVTKPSWIVLASILLSGFSGTLSIVSLNFLPVSLSGAMTAYLFGVALLIILTRIKYKNTWIALRNYRIFLLFLFYMVIRSISGDTPADGLKISLLFSTPIIIGILAMREFIRNPGLIKRAEKWLLIIPILPISVVIINFITGAIQRTALGFTTSLGLQLGPRPLALFLLPILALYVAYWRYEKNIKTFLLSISSIVVITSVIVSSLSRVASLIALLVVLPSRWIKRLKLSSMIFVFVIGIGLLVIWINTPAVVNRFFPQGMDKFRFDIQTLQSIDTQGRRNLWATTWKSAIQRPVFGHGTGSAGALINIIYPPLEHPHNDYLRVFHDMGLIGLFLFLLAWSLRLIRYWIHWWELNELGESSARYQMAAFIATIAICISFLTDNTMTYVFVGIPLFLIFSLADSTWVNFKVHTEP